MSAPRRTSTRSARQQQQSDAIASSNGMVAPHTTSEDDDDDVSATACSVCDVANERVMVTCAACARQLHLGCASPPLRRRPVLASAWQCGSCSNTKPVGSVDPTTAATFTTRRSARNTKETGGAVVKVEDTKDKDNDTGAEADAEKVKAVEVRSARKRAPVARRAASVKQEDADKEQVRVQASVKEEDSSSDAEPPKKNRRTAPSTVVVSATNGSLNSKRQATAAAIVKEERQEEAEEDSDMVPVAQILRSRGSGARQAGAATVNGKLPRAAAGTPTSSMKVSAKAKRTQTIRASANGTRKTPARRQQQRATEDAFTGDSEENENTGDDEDDDGDSDFKSDDASEDGSDDDGKSDDEDASDDEFVAPTKKLPTLKTTPRKSSAKSPAKRTANGNASARSSASEKKQGRKKSPAKARAKGTTNGAASEASAMEGGTTNSADDVDSLDLPNQGEEEEAEEVYTGPRYYIEYAANNRAKCKQCEEKLMKDALRVGVRVRHSIFGITTYYKICASTAAIAAASEAAEEATNESVSAADTKEAEVVVEKRTRPVELIEGFASLTKADQAIVRAHMVETEAQGLLDERLELSEDHYKKKTRMPEKEPSPLLTVPLLPYQREALAWMTAQEKSAYRGGILADEMGMGKTIQAIAVILENVRQRDEEFGSGTSQSAKTRKKSVNNKAPAILRGGTLVVCPLVAVMQWKSEIEKFVERNHLSIYIHHGAKRTDLAAKIASYDIVLTTYSIIESESRKTLGWEKVPCKYCKKKYLPDKLILHNKYFCGPNAKKTKLQDRQQSKKPKRKKAAGESDEDSDDEEEDFHPKKPAPKAKRGKKAVQNKIDDSDEDDDDDTPAAPKRSKAKSPLHQVDWTRIVLDEAHYIKDRRNNTARGVFELKSEYKWCLTGTPLQNRIGELFSLIRFLQIKSYAYYHCNNCDCQLLDFNFPNGKCAHCEHTAMQHFSFFNKKIVIPIQSYGYVAEGKIAMLRLQNEVLQHILLRRTKEGRADDICLPPKLIRIRKDHLDERENDFYEAIYTQSQAQFNTYVSSGTLLNNYAHIFDLLVRLRQAVDHPYLVIFSKSNPALQLPVSSTTGITIRPVVEEKPLLMTQGEDDDEQERTCVICHEDVEDRVVAKCGHDFCRECVKEFIESLPIGAEATCPSCSQLLTVELEPKVSEIGGDVNEEEQDESPKAGKAKAPRAVDLSQFHKHSILHRISDVHAFQTSTKIEALMQELELMRQRDPSGKAIIFSQFVNMLDIIQHRLQLGGVKCVKLSGNMSMDTRDRTIKAFREDSSITAFLISLKAGGVALNLTIASHIFLMDPWWNPAAENQAIDRTHRLGQFKPVQATRFIIAGTVEERILKLQEKKRLIFEGTVGASVSAVCRLTAEDLRFLFSK